MGHRGKTALFTGFGSNAGTGRNLVGTDKPTVP